MTSHNELKRLLSMVISDFRRHRARVVSLTTANHIAETARRLHLDMTELEWLLPAVEDDDKPQCAN